MINNILLYNSGGGIGDSIQILPLINTLKHELKNINLYYISAHNNHFNSSLKELNCDVKDLDLKIKYFGFRWWHAFLVKKKFINSKIKSFDLIIDLQSKIRNTLILKLIPHKYFISPCYNFKLSYPRMNVKKEIKVEKSILNALNNLLKSDFKFCEFDINKIDKKFHLEAEKLLPNNNYVGLSVTQGNLYREKKWSFEKIIEIANYLLENKKTPVFLIQKDNTELIKSIMRRVPKALFPENESNLACPALVSCLGKRLDFVITIDNGIMHMLSLSKVPMIVLFGPTSSEKFAPTYKNIIVLDSKKIYGSNNIDSISVEDVLQSAKLHLNF